MFIAVHSRAKAIESTPPLTAMPAISQQMQSIRPTAVLLIGASNHRSNGVKIHIPILGRPKSSRRHGFSSAEQRAL